MINLRDTAAAFLTYKKWPIFATEDTNLICTKFKGHNGSWNTFIQCHPSQPIVIIYSLFPHSCPENKEQDLLRLITQLNDGLMIGNFEYNFEHREVRFKTSMNATYMSEKLEIFDAPFYHNFLAMDQYFAQLKAFIHPNPTV